MYFPDRTGYSGTYDTSTSPDRVTLDGGSFQDLRDFAQAVTDGVLVADGALMVSMTNGVGSKTWLATFKDAATDYIELVQEEESFGTFTHGDSVDIWATVSGRYIESLEPGLIKSSDTITTTNLTGVLGYSHDVTVSGLTADRSFVIPTGVEKDELEITLMTDSPGTYELVIMPDAGVSVSLGGVLYTAAEATRLFIRGERLRLKVHADGVWYVEEDGRIDQYGYLGLGTALATSTANTWTNIGFDTEEKAVGAVLTTGASSNITVRRSSYYRISVGAKPQNTISDGSHYSCRVMDSGSVENFCLERARAGASGTVLTVEAGRTIWLDAGEALYPQFNAETANGGVENHESATYFIISEQISGASGSGAIIPQPNAKYSKVEGSGTVQTIAASDTYTQVTNLVPATGGDPESWWDATNKRWNVPAGTYNVEAFVTWMHSSSSSTSYYMLEVWVNGTSVARLERTLAYGTQWLTTGGSNTITLTAPGYIDIRVYRTTASSIDLSTDTAVNTTASITQVSAPEITNSPFLITSQSDVTTADLDLALNNIERIDPSGLTADRNVMLPAGAAAGQTCGFILTDDAPADYELILKGDTGVTIQGYGGSFTAAEATRFFISGESPLFMSDGSDTWRVLRDGRIPQVAYADGSDTHTSSGAWQEMDFSGITPVIDTGDIVVIANDSIVPRRGGIYLINSHARGSSINVGKAFYGRWAVDGTGAPNYGGGVSGSAGNQTATCDGPAPVLAGEEISHEVFQNDSNSETITWFLSVTEIL